MQGGEGRPELDLFDSGAPATESFLATFDFERYKEEFRSGRPPRSRRAALLEAMGAAPAA